MTKGIGINPHGGIQPVGEQIVPAQFRFGLLQQLAPRSQMFPDFFEDGLALDVPSALFGNNRQQPLDRHFDQHVARCIKAFGDILQDSDGSWTFEFKNLGEEAIVINRVRSTCGCTVPAWPREPIEPGANGEITVKYNTAQAGTFFKSLYVYSSAANTPVKLQIKGKVIKKEE